jgi:CBS domain-containing protein
MEKVAKFMSDSKIHYLPIFDESENFIGITTARRILKTMLGTDVVKKTLLDVVNDKNRPVITIDEDDLVQNALEDFKEYKISKLVVVDKNMKVKGVISYYDLMPYLVAPGGKQQRATNVNEKIFFLNKKVKNYSQKTILACEMEDTVEDAINSILKHGMGSVIVKDDEGHPVGIVTTRDILGLLQPQSPRKVMELTLKSISPEHEKEVQTLYKLVDSHIQKTSEMLKGRMVFAEEKNGGLFRITVQMTPVKGEPIVIEKEEKNLKELLKEFRKLVTKKFV